MAANYPVLSYTTLTDNVDYYAASPVNLLQDDMTAVVADLQSGWLKSKVVWTYASASTFTCPGDYTLVFTKGTKLMWTQTTVKYGVISATPSYGGGLTTVTIAVNTDHTIANAAITLPYYSYAENPQGYPYWFNWAGVPTVFSTAPTSGFFQFRVVGKECGIAFDTGTGGTSSATTFGLNLPITAATVSNGNWDAALAYMYNGGTALTVAGRMTIASAGTAIVFYSTTGTGAWVAGGNKEARGQIVYPI